VQVLHYQEDIVIKTASSEPEEFSDVNTTLSPNNKDTVKVEPVIVVPVNNQQTNKKVTPVHSPVKVSPKIVINEGEDNEEKKTTSFSLMKKIKSPVKRTPAVVVTPPDNEEPALFSPKGRAVNTTITKSPVQKPKQQPQNLVLEKPSPRNIENNPSPKLSPSPRLSPNPSISPNVSSPNTSDDQETGKQKKHKEYYNKLKSKMSSYADKAQKYAEDHKLI